MAVWEIVRITVPEGEQEDFETVVRRYLPALQEEKGCLDLKLLRATDAEGALLLCVAWESKEYHTEVFTKTETFAEFAGVMAPYFVSPPEAFHAEVVINGLDSTR
ncbi:putative quinol monooxygenase [Streptomyces sp. SPB074]|uniref:putative quinol monooxygenase n=1 Tax=Streptomyces sp. (strain SPB074) TaxID=465543 RepID=UPI0001D1DC01|nr:antibiotic biosynthesis monooxygenase family protein [Streptomyces sp. SPB074]EFG65787.1 antibiotic biosynthesis monooxygenase subfamily [Streptomyces sp. SPB074]